MDRQATDCVWQKESKAARKDMKKMNETAIVKEKVVASAL